MSRSLSLQSYWKGLVTSEREVASLTVVLLNLGTFLFHLHLYKPGKELETYLLFLHIATSLKMCQFSCWFI